jgi:hypothetical protein
VNSLLRPLLACALAATPIALAGCSSSPTLSSSQLLTRLQNAVEQSSSVHYSDTVVVNKQTQTATGSISATRAQVILAFQQQPILTTRLVGTTIYFWSTSSNILENDLGVSASVAAANLGRWIELTPKDAPFNQIIGSMSINSEVSAFIPNAKRPIKVGAERTLQGVKVIPLAQNTSTSKVGSDLTLFISASTDLPVAGTIVAATKTSTEHKQGVFVEWNKPVTVQAPATSVAFSSL